MAHRMRNLPTMTVLAECSGPTNVLLCTPCLLFSDSLETVRPVWKCKL